MSKNKTTLEQQVEMFGSAISTWPIIQTSDGVYRYMNQEQGLLATGFLLRDGLIRNADIIRVTPEALRLMSERYQAYLLEKPLHD